MRTKRNRIRSHWPATTLAFLAILTPGLSAHGQASSNPNQIVGDIAFTNTNSAVLAILNGPADSPPGVGKGLSSGSLRADSIGTTPTFDNATNIVVTSGTAATYEMTVEASPTGIAYRLYHVDPALGAERSLRLDGDGDRYLLAERSSLLVFPLPSAPVTLDFNECVGIVDVQFVDASGLPVPVDGGSITARLQPGDALQAQDFLLPPGTSTETLAIRGDGSDYRIDVDFFRTLGTDAFFDQIRVEGSCQEALTMQCDEIRTVTCTVPFDEGLGIDPQDLGEIVTEVDMLGEDENVVSSGRTLMVADSGPFDNRRFDHIAPTPPSPASSGAVRFSNLLRSDFVSPSQGYRVYGLMSFRLGHAYQDFRTPFLGRGVNPQIAVESGLVTDLGDSFVMDPGFLDIDLLLAGSPRGADGSCLDGIIRSADVDSNGDGIPDDFGLSGASRFEGYGIDVLADGASFSTVGSIARVGFAGNFDPATESFVGATQMVLAGLAREPGVWQATELRLRIEDLDTPALPDSYEDSDIVITNLTLPQFEIVPGEHIPVDHHYCFGEVRIAFGSQAGTFFNPRLSGRGFFTGTDFENNAADYAVRIAASGTPIDATTADDEGMVVACMPAADYTLTPFVTSVDPGGGTSETELPPVTFSCGCRQICALTPEIQLQLNTVPGCTADGSLPIAGTVDSEVEVDRIAYTLDGGPEIEICAKGCGVAPSFASTVALSSCSNALTLPAVDVLGNEASVSSDVTFAQPTAFAGCEAITIEAEPGASGAFVSFDISASNACSGPVEVACSPHSGSFFPEGQTDVTCMAAGACSGISHCSFPVTVTACEPVTPRVRTQGFWKRQCKGPHPSGEHGNLPNYVERIGQLTTFGSVGDVASLCGHLVPKPRKNKCEQAEAQLMALALNEASGRVAICNAVFDPLLGASDVGAALSFVDGLLSDSDRTFGDCRTARRVAARINMGQTLLGCE